MHFDLRVVNGTVVNSQGRHDLDIGVRDGKIVALGDLGGDTSDETLDAKGLHVLPGAIDTQVHFREPGLEHKEDLESGTRCAIMGGVTTIFEMPNTQPNTTTEEALNDKLQRAAGRAWCDYAFFIGASTENTSELGRLEMLPGTPGVKIFMGSSTGSLLVSDDDALRAVLQSSKKRCPIHAEDEPRLKARKSLLSSESHVREHPFLRDPEAARLATERIIRLSAETQHPVHVLHISTLDELPLLASAKQQGLGTTCEVTPQHLTLNAEHYETIGTYAQMNPPIRSEEHRRALWKAVQEGLFDVFGSDHAPHTREEKAQPYPSSPSGMPGVQTMLPILLDWVHKGELPLEQLVKMLMETPAALYGIVGKGHIREGYDADLAIVDLGKSYEVEEKWLQSKCGWSPYTGMNLTGRVEHVTVRGHIAVRDTALQGRPVGEMTHFDWK